MTTASVILHRTSTEPTDRSMPPVMITIVMPSATTATKVKLRVTLNRLFEVANEFVANDRKAQATQTATNTQNAWRDVSHASSGYFARRTLSARLMSINSPLAPLIPANAGIQGPHSELPLSGKN